MALRLVVPEGIGRNQDFLNSVIYMPVSDILSTGRIEYVIWTLEATSRVGCQAGKLPELYDTHQKPLLPNFRDADVVHRLSILQC